MREFAGHVHAFILRLQLKWYRGVQVMRISSGVFSENFIFINYNLTQKSSAFKLNTNGDFGQIQNLYNYYILIYNGDFSQNYYKTYIMNLKSNIIEVLQIIIIIFNFICLVHQEELVTEVQIEEDF